MSAQAETWEEAIARSTAFMDALYTAKLSLGGEDPVASLRESYAMGKISLGTFEAKVEVLLRSAA